MLGEPSRFFYCAKISSRERNEGLDEFYKLSLNKSCEENGEQAVSLLKGISESIINSSIGSSGDSITAIFPKDSLYIIKTITSLITELKTLSLSTHSHIKDTILDVSLKMTDGIKNVISVEKLKELMTTAGILQDRDGFVTIDVNPATLKLFAKLSDEKELKTLSNFHCTVKPQKLMAYLCRLITPPKGIVLDPFMGSGSTGCSAVKEGFDFIGIEREKEYFDIAEKRIQSCNQQLLL
jgi:adenine specific DNA methylase Mod